MEMQAKSTKDAIAEGIKALIAQLESGNSQALSAYLKAMGQFHNYSFGNQMAIAMQKPTASRVAGFQTWKSLGRNVKKGEKAIRILAPMVGKTKDETGEAGVSRVFGFRSVCVFDVEQTDGKELPAFSVVSGSAGDAMAKLQAFAESKSIAVEFKDDLGGAEGLSCGGRIVLKSGKPDAEMVSVFSHELAHELLHKQERRTKGNASQRELEAESVAFIVGHAIGLTMSTASVDYIKTYDGNAEMLRESLESIHRAATEILAAIDGKEVESLAA